MNYTVALFDYVGNLGGKSAAAEDETRPNLRPFTGLNERLPLVGTVLTKQQQLNGCLRSALGVTVKTCGNNTRVVYDKSIRRAQIICYIVKMPVLDSSRRAVYDHKPRGIAHLCGVLSYQLLGKIVIKIMCGQIGVRFFVL